jgi:hypothetical protein
MSRPMITGLTLVVAGVAVAGMLTYNQPQHPQGESTKYPAAKDPESVVKRYLMAWANSDCEGMFSLLDKRTRVYILYNDPFAVAKHLSLGMGAMCHPTEVVGVAHLPRDLAAAPEGARTPVWYCAKFTLESSLGPDLCDLLWGKGKFKAGETRTDALLEEYMGRIPRSGMNAIRGEYVREVLELSFEAQHPATRDDWSRLWSQAQSMSTPELIAARSPNDFWLAGGARPKDGEVAAEFILNPNKRVVQSHTSEKEVWVNFGGFDVVKEKGRWVIANAFPIGKDIGIR